MSPIEEENQMPLSIGSMTEAEINTVFNVLPIWTPFIAEDDILRYFYRFNLRIFPMPKGIIKHEVHARACV